MSRSEASREVIVTSSSASTPSGRTPVRSTRTPPCGRISFSVAVALTRAPAPSTRPSSASLPSDELRALLRLVRLGVEHELGARGRLVRVADAGELLDLAGERLRVEALGVAARALVDRGVDEDLDERRVLLGHLPGLLPRLLVGRDRRDDHRGAGAREARGDPADPLDVGVPVLLREAEALREVGADDVAVEVLDDQAAPFQLGPDVMGDRRLAGPRKAGEPEGETPLSAKRTSGGGLGEPGGSLSGASITVVTHSSPRLSVCSGEFRTRACPSRPSGRPAPPHPARSAWCRGCSRSSGSPSRAGGCRESR